MEEKYHGLPNEYHETPILQAKRSHNISGLIGPV